MSTQPKPDHPDVIDETRKFWHGVAQDIVKGSATSIDETARQVITVVGIMEGLYFHAITFADLGGQNLDAWSILAYLGPLIFWLFSLVSASLVFTPRIYKFNLASSEGAKTTHEDIVQRKYMFLMLSLLWMLIGSFILLLALGIYLKG